MNNTIVTIAIVGTGQQSNTVIATGTPIDALSSQLAEGDVERRLLLTAGALSIYRRAGCMAEPAPALPEPALPEQLQPCSPQAANLLIRMFQSEYTRLLPEVLTLLKQARLRLPHDLLLQALDYGQQNEAIRTALVPILGERGCWLSQINSAWSRVKQILPATEEILPPNTETIWQEGTPGEREELLRRLRRIDPTRARDWLAQVWKHEKAATRMRLLKVLEINLSPADEPLLEKALEDRSEGIRTTAASLLLRLPTSAHTQHMLTRADALLTYSRGKFPISKSKLSITMPDQLDQAWLHDSPLNYPSQDMEEQTRYLLAVISFVQPKHWEERFDATPGEIIAAARANNTKYWDATPGEIIAAARSSKSAQILVEAWSRAVLFHNDTTWIQPLLDEHRLSMEKTGKPISMEKAGKPNLDIYKELLSRLPQQEAEQTILEQFLNTPYWTEMLSILPSPWTHSFGTEILRILKSQCRELSAGSQIVKEWHSIFPQVAILLPPSCFEQAIEGWGVPKCEQWLIEYWRNLLDTFTDTIRIRKQFIEEIV